MFQSYKILTECILRKADSLSVVADGLEIFFRKTKNELWKKMLLLKESARLFCLLFLEKKEKIKERLKSMSSLCCLRLRQKQLSE